MQPEEKNAIVHKGLIPQACDVPTLNISKKLALEQILGDIL